MGNKKPALREEAGCGKIGDVEGRYEILRSINQLDGLKELEPPANPFAPGTEILVQIGRRKPIAMQIASAIFDEETGLMDLTAQIKLPTTP